MLPVTRPPALNLADTHSLLVSVQPEKVAPVVLRVAVIDVSSQANCVEGMERVNPKNSSYPEKPVDFDVVADAGPTESTSVAKAATNTPIFIDFPPPAAKR